jgi:iron(III) transport system substrate-binding protein
MSEAKERSMRATMSRRDLIKGSVALGFCTAASPSRAAGPEPVSITPALADAARKEAKVVLYSSMDLPVGEKLAKAFEAQYPGIEVQVERAGSERLFQRIAQEFSSGIHAGDVVNSADAAHFIPWKKNGWLMPFISEDMANHFLPGYRDPDGMFATTRVWLSSIAYNTNLVKPQDAPTSFKDLLDPKWSAHPAV